MEPPKGTFGRPVSEAARRMADNVNIHVIVGMQGRYAAIRLSDGSSDGIAYDNRADAIRHQIHETQCFYVKIPAQNLMTAHEAETLINTARKTYDAGFRFSRPN
jgi:hypothetical protein